MHTWVIFPLFLSLLTVRLILQQEVGGCGAGGVGGDALWPSWGVITARSSSSVDAKLQFPAAFLLERLKRE